MRSLIGGAVLLAFTAFATPADAKAGGGILDLSEIIFLLLAAIVIFIGLTSLQRKHNVQAVEMRVHGNFVDYMLHVLANAAQIDGRVDEAERQAIVDVMTQVKGAPFARADADQALTTATLSKRQLVTYLSAKAKEFSLDQKTSLLKGVLTVAMADGRFDQREHAAYIDYIAAVGFDRESAPDMLQKLMHDLAAGKFS